MFGDGFIPAHAGKTVGHRLQHQDRRAHPRSRGENICPNGCPAPHRAHPRSRGENGGWDTPISDWRGSSPLTRGKHLCADAVTWDQGLIPAHAGKTCLAGLVGAHSEAHPRSRGENLVQALRFQRSTWLIPAHAGKTSTVSARPPRTGAHPRSRGENWRVAACSSLRAGSSPLTRGKHDLDVGHARRWGLIPAHAGKTCRRRSHSVPCHSPIAEVALVAVGRAHAARTNRFTPGTPSRNMSAQL